MKPLIKQITLACTFICALCFMALGQQKYHFKNQATIYMDEQRIDTLHATPAQMYRIHQMQKGEVLLNDHYYYEYPFDRNIGVRFNEGKKGTSEVYEGMNWGRNNSFKTMLVDGDCPVEFSALYITEKNAKDFRYRVVQNDSKELVTWSIPTVFKYTADHEAKYAYLGKYDYQPEEVLKIEVYNIKQYSQQDGMIIDWRKVVKAQLSGDIDFISRRFHSPDNGLISDGLNYVPKVYHIKDRLGREREFRDASPFILTTSLNDLKFCLGDSLQRLSFFITDPQNTYNYKVSLKRTVDGNTDSISLGETNTRMDIYKEFWKNPGKYKVTFTPKIHKHGGEPVKILRNLESSISFTVLPALDRKYAIPLKFVLLIILIILTTGGFMFMMYRDGQKRKLKREAQNKQIATLQLQSVRAQLNPHFIFNALAGIQNLMNKNEVENANKYLSRFARLTRNILDDGKKELTTIEHETDLLRDYLQMEQMRFGFKFSIDVDEKDIDQQIEIPAMLLQPFVENAVKHGVSALKDEGLIKVGIAKKESGLILTVQDNGKGFSAGQSGGMGMKLCNERIQLLNSIYKNTSILLHQTSGSNGTTITIELNNWI